MTLKSKNKNPFESMKTDTQTWSLMDRLRNSHTNTSHIQMLKKLNCRMPNGIKNPRSPQKVKTLEVFKHWKFPNIQAPKEKSNFRFVTSAKV